MTASPHDPAAAPAQASAEGRARLAPTGELHPVTDDDADALAAMLEEIAADLRTRAPHAAVWHRAAILGTAPATLREASVHIVWPDPDDAPQARG